jgi:copper chaperone CopZ
MLGSHLSNPAFHFLITLVLAIPLYVCATGSIPIAAALIAKGFSPGAALVFLIAGPATNTVTLSFVYSKLGRRSFYMYLASIIIASVSLGLLFNVLWESLGSNVNLISPHGQTLPGVFTMLCAVLLFLIVVRGLVPSKKETAKMKHELSVPDVTCKHCKMTIENAVAGLPGVEKVRVDIDSKEVGVDGDVEVEDIENKIREAGYTPVRKEA